MKKKLWLTKEDVKRIAKLANLYLTDKEVEKMVYELSETLDFINGIKKIDTSGFEPTSQITGLENVFRNDDVRPSLSQKEVLTNAKSTYNGFFKIKAVLDF